MSEERKYIQHYHTTNPESVPSSDLLNKGEIALNIAPDNEKIFIKNTNDEIVTFRDEKYYDENFLNKNSEIIANDLTGVIETTPEIFTLRPSAGDKSIRDNSALIRKIKGNSIVWGQKIRNEQWVGQHADVTFENGFYTVIPNGTGNFPGIYMDNFNNVFKIDHKVLLTLDWYSEGYDKVLINCSGTNKSASVGNFTSPTNVVIFFDITNVASSRLALFSATGATKTVYGNINFYDLTEMFGAGNEPATIEEFKQYFPDSYYEHCEPTVKGVKVNSLKTNGFNQWDEQWEIGGVDTNTGQLTNSTSVIRSKNYIPIIGGQTYSFNCLRDDITLYFRVVIYDKDKNFIGNIPSGVYPSTSATAANFNNPWTFGLNAAYIKFDLSSAYGTTYKNDISINLSHSGVRNGEYQPYEEHNLELPEINKYFPNGMHGIGNAYDEINSDNAINRIGIVDLGTLNWKEQTNTTYNYKYYYANLQNLKENSGYGNYANAICNKFIQSPAYPINDKELLNDSFMIYYQANNTIYIRNSLTSLNDFKNSVNGVLLYYELAEPVVTPLTEPIQLDYWVDDFGVEQVISDGISAPFSAEVVYQFNAEGRIRDNGRNIKKLEDNIKNINNNIDLVNAKVDNTVTGVTINNNTISGTNGNVNLGTVITDLSSYYTKNEIDSKNYVTTSELTNVGYKPYFSFVETTQTISPNIYYRLSGETSNIEIVFEEPTNNNIMNEYFVEFTTTNGIAPTVSFPLEVKWVDGVQPEWLGGYTYQVSVVNNLGVVTKFK